MSLIRDVLTMKIYRYTIIEMADQFNHLLTEEQIRDLLLFYGLIDTLLKHIRLSQLSEFLIKIELLF